MAVDTAKDNMIPAISLQGISKQYGEISALSGVSIDIAPGEIFALLGPNGAGKTTLLHIICTILAADEGVAKIFGVDVVREPARARRNLGVVFQQNSLDRRLTLIENLEFHGLVHGVPRKVRHARIGELLEAVDLTNRKNDLVETLSAGMARRLEIARALIHDAGILVMDEPTVGLDPESRQSIWHYIDNLRRELGITIVTTTHYVEEVENCDTVCILDGGRIVALDSPERLRAQHGREYIRLVPNDAAVGADIMAAFPDLVSPLPRGLMLRIPDASFTKSFLAAYGDEISELSFDRQSLESVFLALTGRHLGRPPVPRGGRQ
jgi:ABC-2 type transport system ATP-binding protein